MNSCLLYNLHYIAAVIFLCNILVLLPFAPVEIPDEAKLKSGECFMSLEACILFTCTSSSVQYIDCTAAFFCHIVTC